MVVVEMLRSVGEEFVFIGLGNYGKEVVDENILVLIDIFVNILCCYWLILYIGCLEIKLMFLVIKFMLMFSLVILIGLSVRSGMN